MEANHIMKVPNTTHWNKIGLLVRVVSLVCLLQHRDPIRACCMSKTWDLRWEGVLHDVGGTWREIEGGFLGICG